MAPGRKRLQKIQMGIETTAGTAVAATTIWRGMGSMLEDQQVVEEIEEQVGILDGTDRTAVTAYMAAIEFAPTPLTFEQIQYPLVAGFGGTTAGVQDGTGSDYIYTTTVPTTAAPTARPYTIQSGDDFEAERSAYCVPTKMTISGKGGETAKIAVTWMGRQVTTNAFTGSVALPTVEDVVTSKGTVKLGAIGTAYASLTTISSQILAFELVYEWMWIPKYTMDGALYWTLPVYAGHKITGNMVFEHDTAVSGTSGAKDFFRTQTARKMRIDLAGSTVTTAGTTYSTKHIIFNLPLKWMKASVIEDQDGNDIVTMDFRSRYNSTAADQGSIIVVNELSSIP